MSATHNFKLEKDLCRCCHAEGSFYNLADPVYNLGQREVYSEMLKSSLDLDVLPMAGELSIMTYTICGPCVLRLRDAHNFKQQVLLCEERFKEMYHNIVIQDIATTVEIKEELPGSYQEEVKKEFIASDDEDVFDIKFDDSDDDQPVIKIKVEESKKAKLKAKSAKPRLRKTKAPAKKSQSVKNPEQSQSEETGEEGETKKPGRVPRVRFKILETDYRVEADNYICCICEKIYHKDNKKNFFSHIRATHYKIAKFRCPTCKIRFQTWSTLSRHKLEAHNIDDRVQCQACDAILTTRVHLRKHLRGFHKLGKKLKCDVCDHEAYSYAAMYKHKFKHSTDKKFQCRYCKKCFVRKSTLTLHEKIHTGEKTKVCKECGQAFVQKASLNYHMVKYHPEVNF